MNRNTVIRDAHGFAARAPLMSCGKKQEESETGVCTPNAAAKSVDEATAGSISGTVRLDGKAPKMKIINMAAEPACAKQHPTPAMTQM